MGKYYLSDEEVNIIILALKGTIPVEVDLVRSNLLGKLLKARDAKYNAPLVGAVNVTGEIAEFVEITAHVQTLNTWQDQYPGLKRLTRFPGILKDGLHLYMDRNALISELRKSAAPLDVMETAKGFPHFPAPNPKLLDNKNALGQTEDQFWHAVDAMMEGAVV